MVEGWVRSSVSSQARRSVLDMAQIPDSPGVPSPAVGEVLPRAAEAFGVRYKLETYSLDPTNEVAV
jgi:hypothetical protein